MNKVCLIANERFEPGLIAFLNSYKLSGNKTPIAILDTGLKGTYPHETVKVGNLPSHFQKAEWMTDTSPYLQLELAKYVNADKYLYMEVDMLVLNKIDNLFDNLLTIDIKMVMDDAAFITASGGGKLDSAGRYFKKGSRLARRLKYSIGYNGGLVLGGEYAYKSIIEQAKTIIKDENQYRLLAQSFLNQYIYNAEENEDNITPLPFKYNFSGINEYYDKLELYNVKKINKGYSIKFCNENVIVPHFTGPRKPWLVKEVTPISHVWDYYYNGGELF